MPNFSFDSIGTIHSCFKEKFGIPRQSGLVLEAVSVLKLKNDPYFRNALRGLQEFSHLWVVSIFHRVEERKSCVRPPRLGGQRKMGVFATRSPHRFNPIGLSVGKLVGIRWDAPGGIELELRGLDLMDGTPVLDIKPYVAYADSVPHASQGWLEKVDSPKWEVRFSKQAENFLNLLNQEDSLSNDEGERFRALVTDVLKQDPRPSFQRKQRENEYGMRLDRFNLRWEIQGGCFYVKEIHVWNHSLQGKGGLPVLATTS